MSTFYDEIIEILIKDNLGDKPLNNLKNKLAKKYHMNKIPTNADILMHASPSQIRNLKIMTKPTRTLSGVAPIALMCKPHKCPHGTCIYCPGGPGSLFGDVPQSYTGKEPSTMRSIRNNYDPYFIVFNRLEQFVILNQNPQKTEIIIQGGTFPALDVKYQDEFVMYIFKALNDFSDMFYNNKGLFDYKKFKLFFELPGEVGNKKRTDSIHKKLKKIKGVSTLLDEQVKNESSMIKCVGLTIETKPDWALLNESQQMLKLGCTRVELGVQTLSEETLKFVNRGHGLKEIIESTRILKDLGFKINYHMMPGLPKATPKSDLKMLKNTIDNANYKPDMYKIYPTMVMQGTVLFKMWEQGKFKAMDRETAADIISDFMAYVPNYIRIMRVQRDIPTFITKAGVDKTNLRQYVDRKLIEKNILCKDIRAREAGLISRYKEIEKIDFKMFIEEYDASKGKEFFISYEDENRKYLYGYCRLRFPSKSYTKEISKESAIIRELHVVGSATAIGKEGDTQHRGFGKKLLKKAEDIAVKNNKKRMVVISGVGVRNYYRKLGYEKDGVYMVKSLVG